MGFEGLLLILGLLLGHGKKKIRLLLHTWIEIHIYNKPTSIILYLKTNSH
jgi:hypothetical protein